MRDAKDLRLAHVGLPLPDNDGSDFFIQFGAGDALPVLLDGCVRAFIPVKNGEFASHLFFQVVQKLCLVCLPETVLPLVSQHICAVDAPVFKHKLRLFIIHGDAQCHDEDVADAQKGCRQKADLCSETSCFSAFLLCL